MARDHSLDAINCLLDVARNGETPPTDGTIGEQAATRAGYFGQDGRSAGEPPVCFCPAYMANGGNGTRAYKQAFASKASDKTLTEKASRLLKRGNVQARLEALRGKVAQRRARCSIGPYRGEVQVRLAALRVNARGHTRIGERTRKKEDQATPKSSRGSKNATRASSRAMRSTVTSAARSAISV